MTSVARLQDLRPDRWADVLSEHQWALGVRAIGEPRLDELHGLLAETSPPFRASLIGHLADTPESSGAGRAMLLALARAVHDARPSACAECPRRRALVGQEATR